jgi:hypothetical protein
MMAAMQPLRARTEKYLERFHHWASRIRRFGFPVALVAQDGLTVETTPWADLDALFIGGSTEFKYAPDVTDLVRVARELGKHTHMGRVSSAPRWRHARRIGIQSYDSSGYSKYFDEMLRREERRRGDRQAELTF